MYSLSAETQSTINDIIDLALEEGKKVVTFAHILTQKQLGGYIDYLFKKPVPKEGASIDRSLSKALCCFLIELYQAGRPEHYSVIRDAVKANKDHQVNDYASLAYWGLIEKSTQGAGFWKVSSKGLQFLQGRILVPESLTIKNKVVVARSQNLVSISDFEGFAYVAYNPVVNEASTENNII